LPSAAKGNLAPVTIFQLPAQQVVTLSPILSFGALIVLVTWTRRYMKAVRDRYEQRAAA
jgi:hypothetical protein